MTVAQLVELLKKVLISPEVIGVTVVIIIYINVVTYVVHYRKRLPQSIARKTASASSGQGTPVDKGSEEEEAEAGSSTKQKKSKKGKNEEAEAGEE
jgi:hypothetical protein